MAMRLRGDARPAPARSLEVVQMCLLFVQSAWSCLDRYFFASGSSPTRMCRKSRFVVKSCPWIEIGPFASR